MDKDRDDQGDIVGIRTVAQQDESVQDSADDNAADEQMDIVGIRTMAANMAKAPKKLKGSSLLGSSVCRDPRKPK